MFPLLWRSTLPTCLANCLGADQSTRRVQGTPLGQRVNGLSMRRLERATLIRDHILAHPRSEWRWTTVSGEKYLEFDGGASMASLRSPFNALPPPPPDPPTYLHALALQRSRQPLLNGLDVWIKGRGKVLSIEWSDDEMRIISMKPGPWEAELFGVGAT